jgi:hypothetical protein
VDGACAAAAALGAAARGGATVSTLLGIQPIPTLTGDELCEPTEGASGSVGAGAGGGGACLHGLPLVAEDVLEPTIHSALVELVGAAAAAEAAAAAAEAVYWVARSGASAAAALASQPALVRAP